jgi:hypothetical protein
MLTKKRIKKADQLDPKPRSRGTKKAALSLTEFTKKVGKKAAKRFSRARLTRIFAKLTDGGITHFFPLVVFTPRVPYDEKLGSLSYGVAGGEFAGDILWDTENIDPTGAIEMDASAPRVPPRAELDFRAPEDGTYVIIADFASPQGATMQLDGPFPMSIVTATGASEVSSIWTNATQGSTLKCSITCTKGSATLLDVQVWESR